MKVYKIAVLPGDGIGPEVMTEALKVVDKLKRKYSLKIYETEALIGGAAIDSTGVPLPESTVDMCRDSSAVLLGSVGGPSWDHLPKEMRPETGGLLALRKKLGLYANIRPVTGYSGLENHTPLKPELYREVDMVTVRELSSGIYFGEPGYLEDDKALDSMVYRKEEVVRVTREAFKLASTRKNRVLSVDKANVLNTSRLWRRTVEEVAEEYPDVELEHMYVDNCAMQMVLNPADIDVVLTSNMFGDILSDESAALTGSLGLLPSASIGDRISLFEPAGGSAPDIAGENSANPVAQILSAALMFRFSFGLPEACNDVYRAVGEVISEGILTRDLAVDSEYVSCSRMGDEICNRI